MKIKVEGLIAPLGLDVEKPRISYSIASPRAGAKIQKSYRIAVKKGDDVMWDSKEVYSGQSANIEYMGPALEPYTAYRVEVAATDDKNNRYTGETYFETGRLATEFKGDFIGAPFRTAVDLNGDPSQDYVQPIVLRKKFHAKASERARLYVSSIGIHFCTLNGKTVGDSFLAPGWTPHTKHLQYNTHDVTGLLCEGENVLEITVANGWYNRRVPWAELKQQEKFSNDLAAIACLRMEQAGETLELVTDESWQCGLSNISMGSIFDGEHCDGRKIPEFDQPAKVLRYDKSVLEGACHEAVKVMERKPVKEIFTTPAGETVLDFGENIVGVPLIRVNGRAGERVSLKFAEVMDRQGNYYDANYRSAKSEYIYTLKDGYQEYYPKTTYYGFRYIKVCEFPGEVKAENIETLVLFSAMERTGHFQCSNENLNQLHRNICRSAKGNYVDLPTDCPQRDERLGWTADAQEFLSTACFLYQVDPFFTKWLKDLALEQGEKGAVPVIVPNINLNAAVEDSDFGTSARDQMDDLSVDSVNWANFWSDAATICPYTIYTYFDDKRILQNQFRSMDRWCDFLYAMYTSPSGVNTEVQYGDWVALDARDGAYIGATPLDLLADGCTVYSIELTLKAAKALGDQEAVGKYQKRYDSALKRFRDQYCTEEGIVRESTQTSKIVAVKYNLVENKELQVQKLAEQIEQDGCRLIVGFIGIPYILEVLSDYGYTDLAYRLLLRTEYPSWLYQVKRGATSIWEHLDGIKEDGSFWSPDMNSFNHYAYGSVGDWMYSRIGGIRLDPEYPGFKHFVIRPLPGGGLTNAQASYESIYGQISCQWKCEGGRFVLEAAVPFNTSATVVLPSGEVKEVDCGSYRFEEPYMV